MASQAKIINGVFGEGTYGAMIVEEAESAHLDLDVACAMLERESYGKNIFGCDHGDTGDVPPYCHQKVTAPRVKALRAHELTNGVGLPQLTYDPFLQLADEAGGAHIPRFQCRVAFEVLSGLIANYPYLEALGAYNAGEGNRQDGIDNGYAGDVEDKRAKWALALGESDEEEYAQVELLPDADTWITTSDGKFARLPGYPNAILRTNSSGWLWLPSGTDTPTAPVEEYEWPYAWDDPDPNSGWYVERNPTRYSWSYGGREDINAWAVWLVKNYSCWVNTYAHHPEEVWLNQGVSREYESFDVWAPGGRGDPIDYYVGQDIFQLLMNDPNPPDIEWIIWQATMYGAWNGWAGEGFGVDPFSWHYDHLHVTYLK